jgi:all-trans-retinol 13,14-reductase
MIMTNGTSYKHGQLADTWDAIVIGSGMGGLTPAALLARAGKRVLVLEQHANAGGCTHMFSRNGYEWDVGLHYVGEVHRNQTALSKVFEDITGGRLEWAPMPEVYNRIAIGDKVYDVRAGVEPFKAQLKDYFPDDAKAIDQYVDLVMAANRTARGFFTERAFPVAQGATMFAQVAPEFFKFSDRTVTEVLTSLTPNRELHAVLTGNYGDIAVLPGQASFATHAMLQKHYLEGASYPVGGAKSIARSIPVIEAAGGSVRVAARVEEILIRDGRAVGVRMADGRELFARAILSDAGVINTITKLLPREEAHRSGLLADMGEPTPSLPAMTLNVGIHQSTASLNLNPANIWVHPSNDINGNYQRYAAAPEDLPMPVCFLTFPSAKDPSWAQHHPDRTTLDLCGFTTWSLFEKFQDSKWYRRSDEYDALKQRLTDELLGQLFRFCPQLKGKIDHAELGTPLTINHFLGKEKGAFMGIAQTPARYRQRWLRAPSPFPGLYFTGQDIAGNGIGGAVIGGVCAASAVLGRPAIADVESRRVVSLAPSPALV